MCSQLLPVIAAFIVGEFKVLSPWGHGVESHTMVDLNPQTPPRRPTKAPTKIPGRPEKRKLAYQPIQIQRKRQANKVSHSTTELDSAKSNK